MKQLLKNSILLLLNRFGYSLVKHYHNKELMINHIESLYDLRYNFPVGHYINAFEIEIDSCISHNGLSFSSQGWHPYVESLKEYANGKTSKYKDSVLKHFYFVFQPLSAFEPCIPSGLLTSNYLNMPNYTYIFPWEVVNPDAKSKSIKRCQEIENRVFGNKKLRIDSGCSHHGPVDEKKGALEYERLVNIYNSISNNGYMRNPGEDGDIMGTILYHDGEYRFIVEIGFHRISALSVLGYKKIPVRLITPIVVKEKHIDYWFQVKTGFWSKKSALSYFHALFNFDSKKWAKESDLKSIGI